MTNITFIVGNGLDISLGMKTQYRDFYDYVISNKLNSDNRIYKAIQESPESWSDFEMMLGRYTDYLDNTPEEDRKNESIKLHDELAQVSEDLANYLLKQQEGLDSFALPRLYGNAYYSELSDGQRQKLAPILAQGNLNFDFVTLNYTQSLEKIISESRTALSNMRIGVNYPLHIHGTLDENMTIGLSEESQLSSSITGAEKDDLIKPNLIYSMNDGRIDTFKGIIDNSSIVVIFGTSLGQSDKYIWEYLAKWLSLTPARHIIIHKRDESYNASVKRNSRLQKRFNTIVQDSLLLHSGFDGDQISKIREQVFVIHNTTKLFASE